MQPGGAGVGNVTQGCGLILLRLYGQCSSKHWPLDIMLQGYFEQ